jgi:hypothetical protein
MAFRADSVHAHGDTKKTSNREDDQGNEDGEQDHQSGAACSR